MHMEFLHFKHISIAVRRCRTGSANHSAAAPLMYWHAAPLVALHCVVVVLTRQTTNVRTNVDRFSRSYCKEYEPVVLRISFGNWDRKCDSKGLKWDLWLGLFVSWPICRCQIRHHWCLHQWW